MNPLATASGSVLALPDPFRLYLCAINAMPIYDVTVPIRAAMPIYEGDPAVEIQAWSALARGDSANVSFLHFGAHTGTHVDAPAHFIEGARKIDAPLLAILLFTAIISKDVFREHRADGENLVRVRTHNGGNNSRAENSRQPYGRVLVEHVKQYAIGIFQSGHSLRA